MVKLAIKRKNVRNLRRLPKMFRRGEKIALVANSNPLSRAKKNDVEHLVSVLSEFGLESVVSPLLFKESSGQKKATWLNQMYAQSEIKGIFDLSGGDLANECLSYLDYDLIKNQMKPFFGYSDLTTILNSLYQQSGKKSYLYQIRNIVGDRAEQQQSYFYNQFMSNETSKSQQPKWEFKRGDFIDGAVLGGNIRCFLKLAGTPYFPNVSNKILFFESYGGDSNKIKPFLAQLEQLGVFAQVRGVLLGTFTELERELGGEAASDLFIPLAEKYNLPLARTGNIGHGADSYCLVIGERLTVRKDSI